MAKQLFWEEVELGQEIPSLVKRPSPRQLVKWAAAAGELYEIHYNQDFAAKVGLPGIIVHGTLTFAFLAQMLTDWIGEGGQIKKLSASYRRMNFPDQDMTCRGKVTVKQVEGGEGRVELDIWVEQAEGERTTPGKAVVTLPLKA